MPEQSFSRTQLLSDVKLSHELVEELKDNHRDYSNSQLLEITAFLTRKICEESGRLRDQTAFLEFQIQSGMV